MDICHKVCRKLQQSFDTDHSINNLLFQHVARLHVSESRAWLAGHAKFAILSKVLIYIETTLTLCKNICVSSFLEPKEVMKRFVSQ